jgi:hypothetical protein
MTDKAGLSLEQSFQMRAITDDVRKLTQSQAQNLAIELHRQIFRMKNQIVSMLKTGTGISPEPGMDLVEVQLPDRGTLLEEARKLPGTRITWRRETGTGSAVPYCAHPGQPWLRYSECLFCQPDRPDMSPGMPTWQFWLEAGWTAVAGIQNNA